MSLWGGPGLVGVMPSAHRGAADPRRAGALSGGGPRRLRRARAAASLHGPSETCRSVYLFYACILFVVFRIAMLLFTAASATASAGAHRGELYKDTLLQLGLT